MKRFLTGIGTALLICTSLTAHAAVDERAGIAAIVNDDIITFSDVRNRMQLYLSSAKSAPPASARTQMQKQILDRLINETLQKQEAKDLGITIEHSQLQNALAQIARQNGLDAEKFKKRLHKTGVNIDTLYEQIRTELSWSQVVRRKLRPQINVTESEIDSMMEQISHSKDQPHYHVAEIFLAVNSPAENESVHHEALKLVKQLTKGAAFSQIAREFSQSPGATAGGDLGWIQGGQIDPVLETALQQMKPGQISPPLRTDKGYHIVFLRGAKLPDKENTVNDDTASKAPEKFSGAIVHLKQILIPISAQDPQPVVNAKIMRARTLKAEITSCALMDKKAKDFSSPGTGDLGKAPINALPPLLRTAIKDLPIGELSTPIRNDTGIAVVMVCGKEDKPVGAIAQKPRKPAAHEASRDEVANRIGMQRLEKMQERYLRDLRATAFIDKRI